MAQCTTMRMSFSLLTPIVFSCWGVATSFLSLEVFFARSMQMLRITEQLGKLALAFMIECCEKKVKILDIKETVETF